MANKWPLTECCIPPLLLHPTPQQWKKGHGSHRPECQVGGPNKSPLLASPFICKETKAQICQLACWFEADSMWGLSRVQLGSLDSKASAFHSFMTFQSWEVKEAVSFRILGNAWSFYYFFLFFLTLRFHLFVWVDAGEGLAINTKEIMKELENVSCFAFAF